MSEERIEYAKFTTDQVIEMAKYAAMMKLVGRMYVGKIGEQHVKLNEDGSVEVTTHHIPAKLPTVEQPPRKRVRKY